MQLNWATNDPGTFDYVALYTRDPRLAGPNGYLLFQSHFAVPARNWISARLWGPGYWIAYIEDYGSAASRRIVAIAGPTQ